LFGSSGWMIDHSKYRQFVATLVHSGSSIEELESLFATKGNPLYEFVT
jgi:hypothetical protein